MSSLTFFPEFIKFVREIYLTEDFIPLHAPKFEGREKELLLNTLRSTFVSSAGEDIDEFERMLAHYTGARFAVATNNGTAALLSLIHI